FLPFIPHYKNELMIRKLGIPFTFLRAGYFMQNLNMFLLNEIIKNNRIFIPAGKGKTSFTDVRDIAEVAALSLTEEYKHRNKKYAITGDEAVDFFEVAEMMSTVLNRKITYSNPSTQEFQQYMIQSGLDKGFVKVVTGLHLGTKLGFAKGISTVFSELTNHQTIPLKQYLEDYQDYWV
ncbi:MAG: NmrA family NAD(P)-binding protein, partial [Bacillus sp. (in: Bacteria)]|nr:NmrA family NAD(P)-binding protein [Bacillus sp. (in: firmicutes)]